MGLENQIAVVTGASRGIGKAIAEELAQQGAHIIGTATSQKGIDAIADTISAAGAQGKGYILDVSSPESINAFLEALKAEGINPTILVNNAGITRDNLLMRMKDEEWDDIIQTNLTSVYRLSKAFLRGMMKARHGRIINIGSVVGVSGNPGQANYAAAKAGIIGFSKALAREIGSRGITVNTINPGFIDSDMTRELPEEQRKALLDQIPLARLGEAKEVAAAVAFLASNAAAYITGETLNVNGGMYMA